MQKKSVMRRHEDEKHEGKRIKFDMKLLNSYMKDPLSRQCEEAILIRECDHETLINNKEEWHQPGDIKVDFVKNDNKRKRDEGGDANKNVCTNGVEEVRE